MRRISKLLGALLGGASGATVAGLLSLAGMDVTEPQAAALAVLLSSLGAYLAPANAEREQQQ